VRNFKLLSREKWMEDSVEHTFLAFQGITLHCARCHDHMYDPLMQREYYQVRAIFEPHQVRIDRLAGEPDTKKDGLARAFDAEPAVATYLYPRGDDRTPDKSKAIPAGVPEALGGKYQVAPVNLPIAAFNPDRRPFVLKEQLATLEQKVRQLDHEMLATEHAGWRSYLAGMPLATIALQSRLAILHEGTLLAHALATQAVRKARLLAEVERLEDAGLIGTATGAAAARELVTAERQSRFAQARRTVFAMKHGLDSPDPKAKGTPAQRLAAAEQELQKAQADLKLPPSTAYSKRKTKTYPATSSGRRLALARWISTPENPLTARVAVNHIWLRHFGQALVPSVFDFGRNGRPPSHPALLDWLAAEFSSSRAAPIAVPRRRTRRIRSLIPTTSTCGVTCRIGWRRRSCATVSFTSRASST
jgi:hypothetical protein